MPPKNKYISWYIPHNSEVKAYLCWNDEAENFYYGYVQENAHYFDSETGAWKMTPTKNDGWPFFQWRVGVSPVTG